MKFLKKSPDSVILQNGWIYKGQSKNDQRIRTELIREQFGFCAYTERHLASTDVCEIEHFDPKLKYQDDYYNYYAVLPWANDSKLKKQYDGSLFFHKESELRQRIEYKKGRFRAIDKEDAEALLLIDFLGFNEPNLQYDRVNHITRLRKIFDKGCASDLTQFLEYLADHPAELSFPTTIEAEFQIDLTDIIQKSA
jgi:hypothetical protein